MCAMTAEQTRIIMQHALGFGDPPGIVCSFDDMISTDLWLRGQEPYQLLDR